MSDYTEHLISMAGGDGDDLDAIQARDTASGMICEQPCGCDEDAAMQDRRALLALVRDQQAQIATAKSDALREAAEHFRTRSDTYHKTMQEMADSREYGVEDIVRYGAYSAEANTTATWLRTRAAITATEAGK